MILDVTQISQILPHRFPFLLVDRVLELEPHKRIVAQKNVTINEPFFPGHFPGTPLMPGVLIIEAMTQAAALLSLYSKTPEERKKVTILFAGIDACKIRRQVIPGDVLMLHAECLRERRGIYKYYVKSMVGDEVCVEAEVTGAARAPETGSLANS